jgi:hypothetical protein
MEGVTDDGTASADDDSETSAIAVAVVAAASAAAERRAPTCDRIEIRTTMEQDPPRAH